jgi:hypothetical protein
MYGKKSVPPGFLEGGSSSEDFKDGPKIKARGHLLCADALKTVAVY